MNRFIMLVSTALIGIVFSSSSFALTKEEFDKAVNDTYLAIVENETTRDQVQTLCADLKGEKFEAEPKCMALQKYFLNKFSGAL